MFKNKFIIIGILALIFFIASEGFSEVEFVDALFLEAETKLEKYTIEQASKHGIDLTPTISDRSLLFPTVNKKENATSIAFKISDGIHETLAIVPINHSGFKHKRISFLTPEREKKHPSYQIFEFTWDWGGKNIFYIFKRINKQSEIKKTKTERFINVFSLDNNKTFPVHFIDNTLIRWHFCYCGPKKFDLVYSNPKGLCKLIGINTFTDSLLIEGDINDPIFNPSMNTLIYAKYSNNDPGIYEFALDTHKERQIINQEGFSEMYPQYSESNKNLAFVSNYAKDVLGNLSKRDDRQNKFNLYVVPPFQSLNTEKIFKSPTVKTYISIQKPQSKGYRTSSLIKWCNSKIYFIPKNKQSALGYWDFRRKLTKVEELNQSINCKEAQSYWRNEECSLKITKIISFDVFRMSGMNYFVISAWVKVNNEDNTKTPDRILLLFRQL